MDAALLPRRQDAIFCCVLSSAECAASQVVKDVVQILTMLIAT